jgi:hypothetical protein
VTNYFAQTGTGTGESFWWTNTDAASSISNAYAVKATSFTGSGTGLTGLNPTNINSGYSSGLSIGGNAASATTATTANSGDSATAFFSGGTIEPARLATNAATANQILRATSATSAKWDTESGTAGFTNYSFGSEVLNLLDTAGRTRLTWQSTIGGNTNTWLRYADGTPMLNAAEELAPSLRVLTLYSPSGGSTIEMFDNQIELTGDVTFSGTTTFDAVSIQNATFTNAIFASNQPPATITPGNGFVIWNSNNVAPYYVLYDNAGNPVSTNAFGGGTGSTEYVAAGTNGIAVVTNGSTYTVHHTGNFDSLSVSQLNAGQSFLTNVTFTSSNNFAGNTTFALPPLGSGNALTNLNPANLALRYEEVWVPANAMNPGTNSAPAPATNTWATTTDQMAVESWDFDASGDEFVQFTFTLPENYDAGNIKVKYYWRGINATSGDAVWAATAGSMSSGDTGGNTLGSAVLTTNTTANSVEKLNISAWSSAITIGSTPVGGDLIWFRLYRDGDNLGDGMANDARLFGVKVRYGVTNAIPSL